MNQKTIEALLARAKEARENSYSPYSHFSVGAALLTESGKIFTGCNVENASYGAAICAERSAFSAAVSAGERDFLAICIVGGEKETTPCGICRQVLSEFSPGMAVICAGKNGYSVYSLRELLPHSFGDFRKETREKEGRAYD